MTEQVKQAIRREFYYLVLAGILWLIIFSLFSYLFHIDMIWDDTNEKVTSLYNNVEIICDIENQK